MSTPQVNNKFGQIKEIDRDPIIVIGYWVNDKWKTITKADLGEEVTFYLQVRNIQVGEKVELSLFEKNVFQTDTDLSKKYDCTIDSMGRGNVKVKLDKAWSKYLDEIGEGDKLEIYFKAKYKNKKKDLSILEVYETKLITVLIELPHSATAGKLNAKGLAGHTGIIVNDDFYDFGPQPGHGSDFYSEGRPWWDKSLSTSGDLKRQDIIDILNSDLYRDNANIVGRVVLIDIHVTKLESDKVEKWWKDKYADLGNYSVWIVSGEQCTTTVKNSLASKTKIFSLDVVDAYFSKDEIGITQTPKGFLDLLTKYGKHTSGSKRGESLTETKNYPELP